MYNAGVSATRTDPEAEIALLAARHGQPRRQRATLVMPKLVRAVTARPKRVAEVVFAIVRPNGRLLLHTKAYYPPAAWRLPSGSMVRGEGIEQALWREVAEETSLRAEIVRFVAVIDHEIVTLAARHTFRSFLFLLRETGGELKAADAGEEVAAFREIAPADLPAAADALEGLGADPDPAVSAWGDWGRYRAVAHRTLWEALATDDCQIQRGPC